MKKLLLVITSLVLFSNTYAGPQKTIDNLPAAIETATKEKKLLFIRYGRETCGNCQNLKRLMKENKVKVFDSEFVVVDLDCDTTDDRKEFSKYREALKDAKTLPFVIIAQSDGTLVSSVTSYQDADDYNKFIREAKKKAKKA
jgi:thioredoxin-related protein